MSIFDGKPNLPGGFFSLANIANLGKSSTQNENSHRLADALGVLDQANNPSNMLAGVRAELLALSGDREGARRLLATVESRFAAEPIPRSIFARIHLALGDTDAVFAWLEKAVEERDQSSRSLKTSPQWDSIRSEPRFQALLARMNLQ